MSYFILNKSSLIKHARATILTEKILRFHRFVNLFVYLIHFRLDRSKPVLGLLIFYIMIQIIRNIDDYTFKVSF